MARLLGRTHSATRESQGAAVLFGAFAAVHRPGPASGAANADFGGDIDAAGILHSIGVRLARSPCAACIGQVRDVQRYEPLARLDRGRRVARMRDSREEVLSSCLGASLNRVRPTHGTRKNVVWHVACYP